MIIIGAGLAGCVAGVISGNAVLLESGEQIPNTHQALLRFRSDNLSKVTGIPFKKVKVFKSIWFRGKEVALSPRMINLYSQKVIGWPSLRSIGSLDTVERYIAPKNFHAILAQMLGQRIQFSKRVDGIIPGQIHLHSGDVFEVRSKPIISTIPMPVLGRIIGREQWLNEVEFKSHSIWVNKVTIPNANVYQTIYYPELEYSIYRASISGDELIVESMKPITAQEMEIVERSFGVFTPSIWTVINIQQSLGKIAPVTDNIRKDFMFRASTEFNVWSLGRYACWRNIMLDDVFHDIFKIRSMIEKDHYEVLLETKG